MSLPGISGRETPDWEIRSALPGAIWPPAPAPHGAMALAMLRTLEHTEWLSPADIRRQQFRQIDLLLRHAWSESPGYRTLWRGRYDPATPLTPEAFTRLPVLKRRALQDNFDALVCRSHPPDHGPRTEHRSSGSTGTPVKIVGTGLGKLFWHAITLRDHAWHKRDLRGTLFAIRHGLTEGRFPNWGPATDGVFLTGPSEVAGVGSSIDVLLERLLELQPEYLVTYPSIAAEFARRLAESGRRPQHLRELRTFGESLSPDARALCGQVLGIPVTDVYSAEEVGYIALQCPGHDHYHVQSENVLVEILDDDGRPCPAGTSGRVVVTDLHNFALPVVRYDLGDYAMPGANCDCGRGLPVLSRILGRVRNTLVTRTGERFWPTFGSRALAEIGAIVQHQMVQTAPDHIEARLVVKAPLKPEEEARLQSLILSRLPAGFTLSIAYCEQIPRSPTGKFEDFISLVQTTSTSASG